MQQHEVTLQGGFLPDLSRWHHGSPGTTCRTGARAKLSTWQPQDAPSEDGAAASSDASPLHVQASGTVGGDGAAGGAAHRSVRFCRPAAATTSPASARINPDVQVVAALPLPDGMTAHIAQLDRGSQQYWTLFRLRQQIRTTYMLLMLMITAWRCSWHSWLALHLSKQVTKPVEALADAMTAIAQGNYDQRVEASATEELGDLVQSFNTMAEDLESSRRLVEQSTVQVFEANVELEMRRRELETMLQTIPNGVVMLDQDRIIRVANRAFSEMLDPGGQRAFPGLSLPSRCIPPDAMETVDRVLRAATAWVPRRPRWRCRRPPVP